MIRSLVCRVIFALLMGLAVHVGFEPGMIAEAILLTAAGLIVPLFDQ